MNIRVNGFVNEKSLVRVEREPTYLAISVGTYPHYGSGVTLFFDSEETLQQFISVISASKEDASVD